MDTMLHTLSAFEMHGKILHSQMNPKTLLFREEHDVFAHMLHALHTLICTHREVKGR